MPARSHIWVARLRWSLLGAVLIRARRQGQAAGEVPPHVREYLTIGPADREVFDTLKVEEGNDVLRVTRPNALELVVTVRIADPPDRRPRPRRLKGAHVVRTLADLCDYFHADEPGGLNRRIYKDTDCGASISIKPVGQEWIHCGMDARWQELTRESAIEAFSIQTIVEGSDATVDSDPFWLPVKEVEIKVWIDDMEAQADELWHEANDDLAEGE